jgi:hypothetical protein
MTGARATIALMIAVAAGCSDVEVVTASYSTMAEARQAGAVDRGWLPAQLPSGAHDIREAHDLDSNRRWGLFSFTEADTEALREQLEPSEASLAGVTCSIPARIEWWPVILRGNLDHERIQSTGLKAYRARAAEFMFVVNWNQRRAYYWSV